MQLPNLTKDIFPQFLFFFIIIKKWAENEKLSGERFTEVVGIPCTKVEGIPVQIYKVRGNT